eukprot:m.29467 g.29467  ORF g.29467 m.29467 type:complete len:478 (+) comp6693_c0_seq1:45-1478(+)
MPSSATYRGAIIVLLLSCGTTHRSNILLFSVAMCTEAAESVQALTVQKPDVNPVIGPSGIPGSQDYCGARDMGIAKAGQTLNLVYSGYSSCSMGTYDHCGNTGCCQLMFSTIAIPPTAKATRLGGVLAPPGQGFYNITTDAYMLHDPDAQQWHMWVTEMPRGTPPHNQPGALRNIGHLTAAGNASVMPTAPDAWGYQSTALFPTMNLTRWSPFAVDEPRVYPRAGGGWIMYIGAQGNNNLGTRAADSWCVGYATAPTLDGPWTPSDGCIIGSGNATGYQAEGFVSFTYEGQYYMIVNCLGEEGAVGPDWLKNVVGDLWTSSSQTEGWTLTRKGFVGRGSSSSVHAPANDDALATELPQCPPTYPFASATNPMLCVNESTVATTADPPCGSWCTQCARSGLSQLCAAATHPRCPDGLPTLCPMESWDSGYAYVTGLAGFVLTDDQPLYGVYMGGQGTLPGAGPISIGLFELSVQNLDN